MIPRTLQIKNFLSYGPEMQTIDFSTYQLICLSGKNGHGKSALLDAITWALWGCARKVSDTSKADEGLVRLGQTHMLVIFDFEFNGQWYRVRREYVKTYGKPISVLDFGMVDSTTSTVIPLTEKTIRATQAKIDSMLNLDAESFVNSAFLRQGHSNEFSKKSAKERKEILANILGISRYEIIRKAALEKIKDASIKKTNISAMLDSMANELLHKPQLLDQKLKVEDALQGIHQEEKKLEHDIHNFQVEREKAQEIERQHTIFSTEHASFLKSIAKQKDDLLAVRSAWRTTHKKLCAAADIKQLEAERSTVQNNIVRHQGDLQKHLENKEQLLVIKEQLHTMQARLAQEQDQEKNKLSLDLERFTTECKGVEVQQKELQASIVLLEVEYNAGKQEKELLEKNLKKNVLIDNQAAEKQFEKRKEYYQKYIAHGNFLKSQRTALEQRKNLVHDNDNPSCPLCEQNLTASRKKFLKSAFGKEEQTIIHQLNRLSTIIKRLKELLVEQHNALQYQKQEREVYSRAMLKHEELIKTEQKLFVQLNNSKQLLVSLGQQLQEKKKLIEHTQQTVQVLTKSHQELLASNPQIQLFKKQMEAIELELKNLKYNQQAHQAATATLLALENQIAALHQVHLEASQQQQRALAIAALCAEIKTAQGKLSHIEQNLASLTPLETVQATLKKVEGALAQRMIEIRTRKEQLLEEKGKIQQKCTALESVEAAATAYEKDKTVLDATIGEYQAIAAATGKDGIQALLIEDALPEIEEEANQLLSKLTNNQSHIIIESLRDLKKGGAKETLDIKISDPVGIRPYEMFSGGEAFRIDFALRIAISKLLARRAGTSLQTLIIDEGFGSQDEEGLQHIMDALYKIQDDFAKIIIVSHLPSMKDQFPVHFFIEKGPNGSCVKVIEQD